MKYLVHLCPPSEVADKVLSYRERISNYITAVSKNVLHCTLMTFPADPKHEGDIISALEGLQPRSFPVGIKSLDLFDENSVVLRLQSEGLYSLHQKVIDALRGFVDRSQTSLPPGYETDPERVSIYNEYGSPYYAQFYNPHISVAQVLPPIPELDQNFFKDVDWKVTELYLSRKEKEWKIVKTFPLEE